MDSIAAGVGIMAIDVDLFVYFLFTFWATHEIDFLQPPNLSWHILCINIHTRLQNKKMYICVKNKILKTLDMIYAYGSYTELRTYHNITK